MWKAASLSEWSRGQRIAAIVLAASTTSALRRRGLAFRSFRIGEPDLRHCDAGTRLPRYLRWWKPVPVMTANVPKFNAD